MNLLGHLPTGDPLDHDLRYDILGQGAIREEVAADYFVSRFEDGLKGVAALSIRQSRQRSLSNRRSAHRQVCFKPRPSPRARANKIMLQSREGQHVPNVTFPIRVNDEWQKLSSDDLFKGKRIVLFALPGAFTPTCSSTHLPRYNELAGVFKENGIDSVICLSVNDPFVMQTWKETQNAEGVDFLPDGNGEFTNGMGLLVDKSEIGLGKRSWRYSMLVKDGLIKKMFIEPEGPGDPFTVSDADTMLNYINPKAIPPARITLFSKPGCPHCARARKLLSDQGYRFEEIELGNHGISYSSLQAVTGRGTTPQVYIDGKHIGGADELTAWLAK